MAKEVGKNIKMNDIMSTTVTILTLSLPWAGHIDSVVFAKSIKINSTATKVFDVVVQLFANGWHWFLYH